MTVTVIPLARVCGGVVGQGVEGDDRVEDRRQVDPGAALGGVVGAVDRDGEGEERLAGLALAQDRVGGEVAVDGDLVHRGAPLGACCRWDAAAPQRAGSGSRRDGGGSGVTRTGGIAAGDRAQRGPSHPAGLTPGSSLLASPRSADLRATHWPPAPARDPRPTITRQLGPPVRTVRRISRRRHSSGRRAGVHDREQTPHSAASRPNHQRPIRDRLAGAAGDGAEWAEEVSTPSGRPGK